MQKPSSYAMHIHIWVLLYTYVFYNPKIWILLQVVKFIPSSVGHAYTITHAINPKNEIMVKNDVWCLCCAYDVLELGLLPMCKLLSIVESIPLHKIMQFDFNHCKNLIFLISYNRAWYIVFVNKSNISNCDQPCTRMHLSSVLHF